MKVKKYSDDNKPKHKKKSKAKGRPRADHKHEYETVLLHHVIERINYQTGHRMKDKYTLPTRVCVLCGRVDSIDRSPEFYTKTINEPSISGAILGYREELSERALSLPEWHTIGFLGKYANKIIDVE